MGSNTPISSAMKSMDDIGFKTGKFSMDYPRSGYTDSHVYLPPKTMRKWRDALAWAETELGRFRRECRFWKREYQSLAKRHDELRVAMNALRRKQEAADD